MMYAADLLLKETRIMKCIWKALEIEMGIQKRNSEVEISSHDTRDETDLEDLGYLRSGCKQHASEELWGSNAVALSFS
jgi:hypothetical protein